MYQTLYIEKSFAS